MATDTVIAARSLVKSYNGLRAVDSVAFEILRGECFGFLGPNGAGKTTTMKMIYCAVPVTEGELRVLDLDVRRAPRAVKRKLGVIPQENNLDVELTVMENLLVYARYYDIPRGEARERASDLLEFVQLSDRADTSVEKLSGGMKRRLLLARGLINRPEILILDEPTTGLDPQARQLIWGTLHELQVKQNVTLVLTTHYMEEAEKLCGRLVVMDGGHIIAQGSSGELIARYVRGEVLEIWSSDKRLEGLAREIGGNAQMVQHLPGRWLFYADEGRGLLGDLDLARFDIDSYLVRKSTLEDVFLKLTGKSLVDKR